MYFVLYSHHFLSDSMNFFFFFVSSCSPCVVRGHPLIWGSSPLTVHCCSCRASCHWDPVSHAPLPSDGVQEVCIWEVLSGPLCQAHGSCFKALRKTGERDCYDVTTSSTVCTCSILKNTFKWVYFLTTISAFCSAISLCYVDDHYLCNYACVNGTTYHSTCGKLTP